MNDNWLTIGQVAARANVNVETVRYYQRIGLVPQPPKPPRGIRHYPPGVVHRIRFIKRAQQLGFSLQDIAQLLALGNEHCEDVRHQAESRLARIESQIRDLQAMRKVLRKLVSDCRRHARPGHCPIVQSLAGASQDLFEGET